MKPSNLITSGSFPTLNSLIITPRKNPIPFPFARSSSISKPNSSIVISQNPSKPITFLPISASKQSNKPINEWPSVPNLELGGAPNEAVMGEEGNLGVQVGDPVLPLFVQSPTKLSLNDQAFFLLSFVACTASVAFTSLVVAAVPTLCAMGRAANSLSKLADTAREELPSTMAAIRLSGMEISDLTLELSDLSHEIADGVNKSTQAVKAAEAGIRQIGALAQQHTISMIQERASLPVISLQPVVAGAAKKTSHAVGQATKTLLNIISRGDFGPDNVDNGGIDRVES